MARQIRPLAQKVAGAQFLAPSAPSAPSAPAVRNTQGSMAAGSVQAQMPKDTTQINQSKLGAGLSQGTLGGTLTSSYKKPTPPKAPPAEPAPDPRDSAYWNNVAALNARYGLERGNVLVAQQMADTGYRQEGERMTTNRERSRRNLAESLLGAGSIYSGMHRRQQTEGDTDYLLDRSRLDEDYRTASAQRRIESADIESRLRPGAGTDWMGALIDAQNRFNEGKQREAEEGAPISRLPNLDEQIGAANKRIKTLRAKAKATNNPKREKALRGKIQNARKRRDALVKKKKAKNG